jgi:hypothetical protein
LIDLYFNDKIKQILKKLDSRPELQLEIVEKFIDKQDDNMTIEEDILKSHISLLAETGKQNQRRIKAIIEKSNRYPLIPILEICKKNKIKDAWAYLEVKTGNLNTGIEISYQVRQQKNK